MVQIAATHFESNLDHLAAELAVLDLHLSREEQKIRHDPGWDTDDQFRGLMVSEKQMDTLLWGKALETHDTPDSPDPLLFSIQQLQEELTDRTEESLRQGVPLRLERLGQLFNLSRWDLRAIVLCLAPEVDLKYQAIFSFLQDDVGKKQPTVNLTLNLFSTNTKDRIEQRKSLLYPAPLARYELVQVSEGPYSKDTPFLARTLCLDPRIVDFLLGSNSLSSRLIGIGNLMWPEISWDEVVMPEETKLRLSDLAQNIRVSPSDRADVILQLVGPAGTGKKSVVQAFCNTLNKQILLLDCKALSTAEPPVVNLIKTAYREAQLQNAILCWENFHILLGDDANSREILASVAQLAQEHDGPTILSGETSWRPETDLAQTVLLTAELPLPGYLERKIIWKAQLEDHHHSIQEQDLDILTNKFRFTGGQIRKAVLTARDLSLWRSWNDGEITVQDADSASRWHSSQRLGLLAKKIRPGYSWTDIVLPPDQKGQLKEVFNYFQNMSLVYDSWGFQSKTSLGKGLNVLFAGSSGTGKTMAAEIMAGELGLDLYKIDLSNMVSKYIGETEKNLDRIFSEAQDSNAILFFDEADALFGKRSEVKDSHDRYANIEISYLLQKMEEYDGISILTTNFRKNIDDAFVRRLHFAVEFPFPEEEYRLQIWQFAFPEEAPLSENIDMSFLAQQFKIAGGNIKNVAVTAAFLAAQDGESIAMEHLIQATKREYQKMGKLLVENDFGPYFQLVKG